ncbi:UV DNA damage repair endonuclease UvsE [Nannocystis radixulma]|uniref:UV DNA damage repair endonuclease UvsE n=1 Tax=Nannocystis radixulma TaxID=2995305 RepID=A0ABT5BG72_9BACT|nr:UV DNA damage repair endonuclease UvsE [Nannocystis radixulma]MDC0672723.1 UV DNA damage repair endonuclease UvsE [Nannocystis radixulma]
MRLGLCCTFLAESIKFRATTVRFVGGKPRAAQRLFLGELALDNAAALASAVTWCAERGVGAFRISSQLFPLATHPEVGYALEELPTWGRLERQLKEIRATAQARDIRLSFHPDQFVVPGSMSPEVVKSSIAELEHQARMAELVGAEQITLHGGGGQPDKATALARLERGLDRLSPRARARIVLENDDRVFTVADLLPLCERAGLPLVYDVHHHRCLPDHLSVEGATELAAATWGAREPWTHVSSPKGGWTATRPQLHDDHVRPEDVPRCWLGRRLTMDVEAKAKEQAVLRLLAWVRAQERRLAA